MSAAVERNCGKNSLSSLQPSIGHTPNSNCTGFVLTRGIALNAGARAEKNHVEEADPGCYWTDCQIRLCPKPLVVRINYKNRILWLKCQKHLKVTACPWLISLPI